MTRFAMALAALAATTLAPGVVQSVHAQAVQAQARGEVVRVDAASGKVALRHGAISAFDLPAMTLVYQIDPALLQGIARGDTVDFTAEREQNHYRVTAIRKR